jgi:hypothetical protein
MNAVCARRRRYDGALAAAAGASQQQSRRQRRRRWLRVGVTAVDTELHNDREFCVRKGATRKNVT